MKSPLIALLLSCGISSATTVISQTWDVFAPVPDNSTVGWSDTRLISSTTGNIIDVQVHLQISGGFNGDLYAYLTHDSGFAVLLNRPGKTASNPDGSFTTSIDAVFVAAAGLDVHNASSFAGIFQPDGRNVSPLTVTDASPRTALLTSFLGSDPTGGWTLFVADLSPMGQSTVSRWGLTLTTNGAAVPEPSTVLGAGVLLMMASLKRRR